MKSKPALKQVWPETGESLKLLEALSLVGEDSLGKGLLASARSFKFAEKMSNTPIVAITGELNSGKSSVIGTFLSSEGLARVPRGVKAECGTHRFVYWLPKSWSEEESCKKLLMDHISSAHGDSGDFLSMEPAEAEKQYASGRDNLELLNVPLIAWDSRLDELGIGLLDCPDIQTKDEVEDVVGEEDYAINPRLDFLVSAARVCSAFYMVWSHETLRNRVAREMIKAIRAKMGKAPLYLLVNKINPAEGSPKDILEERDVSSLMEMAHINQKNVFGAYHFQMSGYDEGKGWRDYTPSRLLDRFDQDEKGLPQFYPLCEGVDTESDLFTLTKKLKRAELQEIKIDDHRKELSEILLTSVEVLRNWVDARHVKSRGIHGGLLGFCKNEMTAGDGKSLQVPSREFLEALNESFINTAPWLAQKSLKMAKPFQSVVQGVVSVAKRGINAWQLFKTNPKQALKDEIKRQTKGVNLNGLVLNSNLELAKKMNSQRWCPAEISVKDLERAWEEIFKHYTKHPIKTFDSSVLDQTTKLMWDAFSGWKKFWIVSRAWLGTLGSLAAVVGILTAAVDGGATLFAFTSLSTMIHGSLFATLGAGGLVAAGPALVSLQKMMTEQNTLPYLSRFFATAADAFGLPRKLQDEPLTVSFVSEGNSKNKKVEDSLPDPVGLPPLESQAVNLCEGGLWEIDPHVGLDIQVENTEDWVEL